MYQPDLSKYDHTDLDIFSVGWLDSEHTYRKGEMEFNSFIKAISLEKALLTNRTRGVHACPFCPTYTEGVYIILGQRFFLGSAELWIPNEDYTKVFAAPNLILHYIYSHSYLPPEEFIDSINKFDLRSAWTSEKSYQSFIEDKYGSK